MTDSQKILLDNYCKALRYSKSLFKDEGYDALHDLYLKLGNIKSIDNYTYITTALRNALYSYTKIKRRYKNYEDSDDLRFNEYDSTKRDVDSLINLLPSDSVAFNVLKCALNDEQFNKNYDTNKANKRAAIQKIKTLMGVS